MEILRCGSSERARTLSEMRSLTTKYVDVIINVPPNVYCTAILHSNSPEIPAAIECLFVYLFQCVGKFDFFDTIVLKAVFSDVLHALRNFNSFEILAKTERIFLDSLQRGGKCDALYRTPRESRFSEFLKSFVQSHTLQLLTLAKRAILDIFHARWKDYFLETTVLETIASDNLEAVWKLDVPQARATIECAIANLP